MSIGRQFVEPLELFGTPMKADSGSFTTAHEMRTDMLVESKSKSSVKKVGTPRDESYGECRLSRLL